MNKKNSFSSLIAASIFWLYEFTNLGHATTCSPLFYSLAADTLRAKWGAPHNIMLQGQVVSLTEPACKDGLVTSDVIVNGRDLKTSQVFDRFSFKVIYADEIDCMEYPNSHSIFAVNEFSSSDPMIFFLETWYLGEDKYSLSPTECHSSIWPIELTSIVTECMRNFECSVSWFDSQNLPGDYSLQYYK